MGQVKEVTCDECGERMFQNYHSSVMIPDYMQAGSEEADQMEWVRNRMNTRPSGNAKAVY